MNLSGKIVKVAIKLLTLIMQLIMTPKFVRILMSLHGFRSLLCLDLVSVRRSCLYFQASAMIKTCRRLRMTST